jgi:hypothetical protein
VKYSVYIYWAIPKLDIRSLREVCNECGLIYSGGPTTVKGTQLKNGYMKGAESFDGVDQNAPKRESKAVRRFIEVPNMVQEECGGRKFLGVCGPRPTHTVQRGMKRVEKWGKEEVTVGYEPMIQHTSASQYPGYIFSAGDLNINTSVDSYLGTIVSGGDIYIKTAKQKSINFADRGLLIARGNIRAELQKAALAQLAIQAQNVFMNLVDDLLVRGIVRPVLMPDGSAVQLINLQKLGQQLGFLIDESTFARSGSSTGLIVRPPSTASGGLSIRPTRGGGFMVPKPDTPVFMSSVQDSILNQLVTLIMTPMNGRDILLTVDLVGQLERTGAGLGEMFRSTQSMVLPEGNSAILFDKSQNPDVELEDDKGEKMLVPLYDPHLLCDVFSRLKNRIEAEQLLHIKTLGNIRLEPDVSGLSSKHLTLESEQRAQIAAKFVCNGIGTRIGGEPLPHGRAVVGIFRAENKGRSVYGGCVDSAESLCKRSLLQQHPN